MSFNHGFASLQILDNFFLYYLLENVLVHCQDPLYYIVMRCVSFPEPQIILGRMTFLKHTETLSNQMEACALHFSQHGTHTSPRIDYLPNYCPQRRRLDLRSVVDGAVFFCSSEVWVVYNHMSEEAQGKSSLSASCSFLSSKGTLLVCPTYSPTAFFLPDD